MRILSLTITKDVSEVEDGVLMVCSWDATEIAE